MLSSSQKIDLINRIISLTTHFTPQEVQSLSHQPFVPLATEYEENHPYRYISMLMQARYQVHASDEQKQLTELCYLALLSRQLPIEISSKILALIKHNLKSIHLHLLYINGLNDFQWDLLGKALALCNVHRIDMRQTQLDHLQIYDKENIAKILASSNFNSVIFGQELHNLTIDQLKVVIEVLAKCKISSIDLDKINLGLFSKNQIEVFTELFTKNKIKEISGLEFVYDFNDETFQQLNEIFKYCTSLNLYYSGLAKCSVEQFQNFSNVIVKSPIRKLFISSSFAAWCQYKWQIFGELLNKSSITILDISRRCDLCYLQPAGWIEFGNVLKGSHIFKLNLNGFNDHIFHKDDAKWQAFLQALSLSPATDLDLGNNLFLQKLSAEQWNEFGLMIKNTSVKKLGMGGYYGFASDYCIPKESWSAFCKALEPCTNITHLDLMNNALYRLEPDEWQLLTHLCRFSNIKNLSLAGNGLSEIDSYYNSINNKILDFIKSDIIEINKSDETTISLDENQCKKILNRCFSKNNKRAFEQLSEVVAECESINLSYNNLCKWEHYAWDIFCTKIKNSIVQTIIVNDLPKENLDQLSQILQKNRIFNIARNPNEGGLKYLIANWVFHHKTHLANKDTRYVELINEEDKYGLKIRS